jgi:uncharacterized protein (DUF1501 family)
MLTLWGSPHRFCDRVSRRDFLRAGALGLGGLTLPGLLRLQAATPEKRRKSVIMVCLAGGPSSFGALITLSIVAIAGAF